jgi:serine/threonine protein kinase
MPATAVCRNCAAALDGTGLDGLCSACVAIARSVDSETTIAMPTAVEREAASSERPPDPGNTTRRSSRTPRELISPAEFKRQILELGLIGATELELIAESLPFDTRSLADALRAAGKLTPHQAAAIAQGKARGLFVGDYVVLRKLGRGGMGVVFLARHRVTRQLVALKILPPSFGRNVNMVSRFQREYQFAARLRHPNLVSAFEAAEDRGVNFLTMEYVDGRTLRVIVRRRGPLPVAEALDCVIQAARGLEAAHAQGIVHRDIKPANLMLDESGTVRVLDLGLARFVASAIDQSTSQPITKTGVLMGTVDYMAPEQALDSRSADHRADIYSLGCTLYFLLTARRPFDGATTLNRIFAHQAHPAPALQYARADVSDAIERVYLAMMAKSPDDRLPTMGEVIKGLEACRMSANEATAARQALRSYAEICLRPDSSASAAPSSGLSRSSEASDAELDSEWSEEEFELGIEAPTDVAQRPIRLAPAPADKLAAGRRSRSRIALRVGVPLVALAVLAGVVWALLRGRTSEDRPSPDQESAGPAILDPKDNGSRRIEGGPASGAEAEGTAAPAATLVPIGQFLGHSRSWAASVAVVPGGQTALTTATDNVLRHWDTRTGHELRAIRQKDSVRPVLALPNGRQAVTGCHNGIIYLWELATGKEVRQFLGHVGQVWGLSVSRDGRFLISGGNDATARLWHVETGQQLRGYSGPTSEVWCAAISPDGSHVLFGTEDGTLWHGETHGDQPLLSLKNDTARIWSVAFAPDGRMAASGDNDGRVTLWDLETKREKTSRVVPNRSIRCVAFGADGRRLLLGDATPEFRSGGSLHVWDSSLRDIFSSSGSGSAPLGLAELPTGGLVTCDDDGIARIWVVSPAIAEARGLQREARLQAARLAYDIAVSEQPNNPRLLIERGRLLAELGQLAESAADFNAAAELAPDEPQLFLDDTWWVAGPYPAAYLDSARPFDRRPVIAPSEPALSAGMQPRPWRRVPVGLHGAVDLSPMASRVNVGAYALNVINANRDFEAVLSSGFNDRARIWINGELIHSSDKRAPVASLPIHCQLKRGRNTILIKILRDAREFGFSMRVWRAEAPVAASAEQRQP